MLSRVSGDQSEIFAANRAIGRIEVAAAASGGTTRRTRVHEDGSLRVRFPNVPGPALEAVIINTAGGIAGGDRFAIDISLEAGADVVAGTAAAEKVYRSIGPDSDLDVRLAVAPAAKLAWLPQETILFDRARLSRRIDIELADDASLIMCESVVFGRSAMSETVAEGYLCDRWRLRRGGRLVYAETLRLDGAIDHELGRPAVAAGAVALATLLLCPGDDAAVEAIRGMNDNFRGEVGASAWNGIAVARFCAQDGAALRHDLICVLAALKRVALPRLWLS